MQNIKGIGASLTSGHSLIVNCVLICILYASLPPEQQMLAFHPKPAGWLRKVILTTNILTVTSVTLDGIHYFVDCGKHKSREYKSSTGMESLVVSVISKAQAAQWMGQADCISEGICPCLHPNQSHDLLAETTVPEILKVNLAQVVLQLKGMGIHDPRSFSFLTLPSSESIKKILWGVGSSWCYWQINGSHCLQKGNVTTAIGPHICKSCSKVPGLSALLKI